MLRRLLIAGWVSFALVAPGFAVQYERAACTQITATIAWSTWCRNTTDGGWYVYNGTGASSLAASWTKLNIPTTGTGTVRVDSGTVSAGNVKLESYATAGAPAAGTAGRLSRFTDGIRGPHLDTGTQWLPQPGWANVALFATGGTGTVADPWTGYEAAVNALAEDASIYFQSGNYRPASNLDVKNGWSLFGDGPSTIIRVSDATLNPFVCNGKTRIALGRFRMVGPNAAAGGEETGNIGHFDNCSKIDVAYVVASGMNGGFTFKRSAEIQVDALTVDGSPAYTIYMVATTGLNLTRLISHTAGACNTAIQTQSLGGVRSGQFQLSGFDITCGGSGIQIRDTDNVEITTGRIQLTSPGDWGNAIGTNNSSNVTIGHVNGDGGGVQSSVFYFADSSNILSLSDLIARNAGRDGFQFGSAGTLHGNLNNLMVYGGGNGGSGGAAFRIDTDASLPRVNRFNLTNLNAEGFNGHCLNIIGAPSAYINLNQFECYNPTQRGLNIDTASYLRGSNIFVYGAGAAQANYVDCSYCTFTNLHIIDSDGPNAVGMNTLGTGTLLTNSIITQRDTTGQDYAIRDQSGTWKFVDNDLTGNQVAPISVVGGGLDYRQPGRVTVGFSATPTFDVSQGDQIELAAMTANITGITISNAYKGQMWTVTFTQDGTGSRTVAGWPASVLLSGAAFTPTATAGAKSSLTFRYDGTNHVEIARDLDVR